MKSPPRRTPPIPLLLSILFLSALVPAGGCTKGPATERLRIGAPENAPAPTAAAPPAEAAGSLRIAVGGMITPKEGFAYYRRLLDYIADRTGRPVVHVDRRDYAEINRLLRDAEVDMAFVCGGPYVDGHEAFGLELLAAPVVHGETVYYADIIVPADAPVRNLEELRGATFAFTDPLSNTGRLVPEYMLAQRGETPERFFGKTFFTYAHDRSILAVARGVADAASVDSLIFDYTRRSRPELTARVRILTKSPPYGIPPVVVRPGLDAPLKRELQAVLLAAHEDGTGREILRGMMIDRFTVVPDGLYDSIRRMKRWLARRNGEEEGPATEGESG